MACFLAVVERQRLVSDDLNRFVTLAREQYDVTVRCGGSRERDRLPAIEHSGEATVAADDAMPDCPFHSSCRWCAHASER